MAGAVVVSWEERPDGLVLSLEAEAGEYDAATVAVVPDTEILQVTPSGTAVATTAEVVEATRLDVWFTGPVAESHPVQATAGTVLLRD